MWDHWTRECEPGLAWQWMTGSCACVNRLNCNEVTHPPLAAFKSVGEQSWRWLPRHLVAHRCNCSSFQEESLRSPTGCSFVLGFFCVVVFFFPPILCVQITGNIFKRCFKIFFQLHIVQLKCIGACLMHTCSRPTATFYIMTYWRKY